MISRFLPTVTGYYGDAISEMGKTIGRECLGKEINSLILDLLIL